MKKFLKKIILVFLIIALLVITNFSYATETNTENTELTPFEENFNNQIELINNLSEESQSSAIVTEDDVYKIEDNISIETNVVGNVYLIGNVVDISATIHGNAFVIGQTVTIKGDIEGSLYIMAQSLEITSYVDSIYSISETFNLRENGNIIQDLRAFSSNINIDGTIYRNIYAFSENVNITESGNIYGAGEIEYSNQYNNSNEINDNITITKVETAEVEEAVQTITTQAMITSAIKTVITAILIIIIIYFVVIRNRENSIENGFIKDNLLTGIISVILIPILAIFVMLTVVGLPISFITLILYAIALYVALPVAAIKIAKIILIKKNMYSAGKLILGASIVYILFELLKLIPVLGGMIRIVFVVWGFGVILRTMFIRKKDKIETNPIVTEG